MPRHSTEDVADLEVVERRDIRILPCHDVGSLDGAGGRVREQPCDDNRQEKSEHQVLHDMRREQSAD
jgi:hypothetical protein